MKTFLFAAALVLSPLAFPSSSFACGDDAAATTGERAVALEPAFVEQVMIASAGTRPDARRCHDDLNCPPGDRCVNGVCVLSGFCFHDFECGPGGRCIGNRCH